MLSPFFAPRHLLPTWPLQNISGSQGSPRISPVKDRNPGSTRVRRRRSSPAIPSWSGAAMTGKPRKGDRFHSDSRDRDFVAFPATGLATGKKKRPASHHATLPRHILSRVLVRMHALDYRVALHTLAAEAGYSQSHFVRIFRSTTGETPHQYLMQLRLQRAQELLAQPQMSLIDIAAACGFSNHAHMCRLFRRVLGITPSEFRRAMISGAWKAA